MTTDLIVRENVRAKTITITAAKTTTMYLLQYQIYATYRVAASIPIYWYAVRKTMLNVFIIIRNWVRRSGVCVLPGMSVSFLFFVFPVDLSLSCACVVIGTRYYV